MNSIQKIIWAVDPYSANAKIKQHAIKLLRGLGRGKKIEIHPVYVMTLDRVDVPAELFFPQIRLMSDEVQSLFERKFRSISLPGLKRPRVIVKPIYTAKGAVKALDSYAHKIGASLIAVGTHARKGLPRLFLGSFAETLLLYSTTPTIVVGPHAQSSYGIKNILFPTDFGVNVGADLERVAAFAKYYKAKITIFHSVQRPLVLLSGPRAVSAEAIIIKEQEAASRKKAEILVMKAEKMGVVAVAVVATSDKPVADEILKAAESENTQMIAMVPQSGWASSSLIGSSTRQVVRASDRPVWLLHEHAIGTSKARKRRAG